MIFLGEGAKEYGLDAVSEEHQDINNGSNENSNDQLYIISELRADAKDFYPLGMTPDPIELSQCLEKLKLELESVDVASQQASPSKSRYIKQKSYKSQFSSKLPESSSKQDFHIGFTRNTCDSDSDDEGDESPANVATTKSVPKTFVTYSPSPSSQSALSGCSSIPYVLKNSSSENSIKGKHDSSSSVSSPEQVVPEKSALAAVKQPRPRRLMRNALISSLKGSIQSPQQQLMKPIDFEFNQPMLKSESSAFHTVTPSCPTGHNVDNHLETPYDFLKDPTIDIKTKNLLKSLASSPSSSSSSTPVVKNNLSWNSNKHSNSSKLVSELSKPKFRSSYEFQYDQEEFPPLA